MALSPGISRLVGGTAGYAGGYPFAQPVADVASAPSAELTSREALVRDSFTYSDFAAEQQKRSGTEQAFSQSFGPGRQLIGSLFSTSTESFSVAFQQNQQFHVPPSSPGSPGTKAALDHGIETYEFTAAVIHDDLAPRGENVSLTV